MGSWFGFDFDFDDFDDTIRLFVGAPLQQHNDGQSGAIYFSDYDLNEWKNARQLPHQLLRDEWDIKYVRSHTRG